MLKKITKRDLLFDKKIKILSQEWFDFDPFLIIKDRGYGKAELWKFIIYHVQRDAARSLFYAYSNQHPLVGHEIKRDAENKIIFSSQVLTKAYYLRYGIILLQACGDKLAQLIRCSLHIDKWPREDNNGTKEIEASEDTTTLIRLRNHLKLNGEDHKPLLKTIDSYLKNKSVKFIVLGLANEIKHRWVTSYQGEGLFPVKPKIKQEKNGSDRVIKEVIPMCGMTSGVDINIHTNLALITNNLFVDTAEKVKAILNFDKFYIKENGKKYLAHGL